MSLPVATQNTQYFLHAGCGLACAVVGYPPKQLKNKAKTDTKNHFGGKVVTSSTTKLR
jgi:hypothetical protein